MKNNFLLLLTLLLLINKSNNQTPLELGECLFQQLGFKVFSIIGEYLSILFSLDEEKLNIFFQSHPEILYATSYCMTKPELVLKHEAEKIIKNFFDISYKISVVSFDEEHVICEFPKITLKFETGCDFNLIDSDSYIKIKKGTVISEKGMETTYTNEYVEEILKLLGLDIRKMSIELKRKIQGAISDGTVYIKIYLDKLEIGFIINREFNEEVVCEGKIIITIEAGDLPTPPPAPAPAPAYSHFIPEEVLQKFKEKVLVGGGLVAVIYMLFLLAKGFITWVLEHLLIIALAG